MRGPARSSKARERPQIWTPARSSEARERPQTWTSVLTRSFVAALLGLASVRCGGAGDGGSTATSQQAIIGGAASDALDSPVLYLSGPEGGCTAVLVAPRLVITARHCVASSTSGNFSCTPAGDLVPNATHAGAIGTDDPPSSVGFFSPARVADGAVVTGSPDATGTQIVSVNAPTACRDDLALVVLDRSIPGLVPAAIRISSATRVGETVSVWGYGLTDHVQLPSLRVRTGVPVTAIGPDTPPARTQPAPLRCLRTGPVTCQGDSGGPMMSESTGAVIAVVSLGSQAGTSGPYCASDQFADTVGPRLAAYHDLILEAFRAAGASPIAEVAMSDAASASEGAPAIDGAPPPDPVSEEDSASEPESSISDSASAPNSMSTPESATGVRPTTTVVYRVTGASCAMGREPRRPSSRLDELGIALAWTAAFVGRRRR
jgi:hypothetical protein